MSDFTFTSDRDTDPVSVDAYAAVPLTAVSPTERIDKFRAITSGPISANWKNTGADTIKVKVLGSNEGEPTAGDEKVVVAEATIAAAAMLQVEIPIAYYAYYWFMHASNAGGTPGASNIQARHARI